MSEKKKITIIVPRKPPSVGGTAAANNWSPGSKPVGPAKPLPPKAAPAAQPSDEGDGDIETWRVDDLTPHPLQAKYFSDLPAAQFDELVADIKRRGMREPVEILPSGLIISGHQRRRAAIRLNKEEVLVRVRHDLANAGEAAEELALIQANRHRRQLSKIEQARCYKRVRELKTESGESFGRGQLREEFAKQFGMSGRNLDRYAELLDHPKELQDAVDSKQLPLIKALQLMKLTAVEYEPVLQMLREGRSVRKAVNQLVLGFERSPVTGKVLSRLLRDWVRLTAQLDEHLEAVAPLVLPRQRHWLTTAQRVAAELLATSEGAEEASTDEDTEGQDDDEPQNDGQLGKGDEAEYI